MLYGIIYKVIKYEEYRIKSYLKEFLFYYICRKGLCFYCKRE